MAKRVKKGGRREPNAPLKAARAKRGPTREEHDAGDVDPRTRALRKVKRIVVGGDTYPVKAMGKGGVFSIAYRVLDDPSKVLLISKSGDEDVTKTFLAWMHEQYPDDPHLPVLEDIGTTDGEDTVFLMDSYVTCGSPRVKKMTRSEPYTSGAYAEDECEGIAQYLYKAQRRAFGAMLYNAEQINDFHSEEGMWDRPEVMRAAREDLIEKAKGTLKRTLKRINAGIDTWEASDKWAFDLHSGNWAYDKRRKKLILLDPLMDGDEFDTRVNPGRGLGCIARNPDRLGQLLAGL